MKKSVVVKNIKLASGSELKGNELIKMLYISQRGKLH